MKIRVFYRLPRRGKPHPRRTRSRYWDWTFDELLEALLIEARTGRMPDREELTGHA